MQRFNEKVDSDLTIERTGGDEISLMTEVVLHRRQNAKLFVELTVNNLESQDSSYDNEARGNDDVESAALKDSQTADEASR